MRNYSHSYAFSALLREVIIYHKSPGYLGIAPLHCKTAVVRCVKNVKSYNSAFFLAFHLCFDYATPT